MKKPSVKAGVKKLARNEITTATTITPAPKNNNSNMRHNKSSSSNNDNPAPVLENDTHKLQWDFNIHTDHLIPVRRPGNTIFNKKKRICKIIDFAVPADHRINLKECEKKNMYLDLGRKLKRPWNMKVTIVPIVIGAFGTISKGLLKGLEDLEIDGWGETIQMTSITENGHNPETGRGDLSRLVVTQILVKNYQLARM